MNLQESTLLLLSAGAAAADLRCGIIPNSIVAAGIVCGILGNCAETVFYGLLRSMAGMVCPLLFLGVLFRFHMIGAGDVKLLCMAGAFTGPAAAFRILIYTFLTGGLLSAVLLLWRGTIRSRFRYLFTYAAEYLRTGIRRNYLDGVGKDGRFCFAVPIFLGICIEMFRVGSA